jgi:GNAT superfamily N-acetyltransferase
VTIEARLLDDAQAFLAEAGAFLLEDEPRHNLILGIAGTIRADPGLYPERRFWIVTDGAETVAAALRTPPYQLVLARPRDESALATLVDGIDDELPGVGGAVPEVESFARHWARRHGIEPRVVRGMGVYALERVQPLPRAPGASRAASGADRPLLLDWMHAFGDEVLNESDPDQADPGPMIEHRLASADAGFVVWENGGEPVSFAGWGGPTPNGIRIGPVYTPPGLRGRGYATTLVAELSATLLERGRSFCFLFTDLANPTSNAIYERIGYVRVCESAQVSFERP